MKEEKVEVEKGQRGDFFEKGWGEEVGRSSPIKNRGRGTLRREMPVYILSRKCRAVKIYIYTYT